MGRTSDRYTHNSKELLASCVSIAESYMERGLKLTVRQLYYQLVARTIIGNSQRDYKRVVATLSAARYAGKFPMDWLEDRGRDALAGADYRAFHVSVPAALNAAVEQVEEKVPLWALRASRWWMQPTVVSVWVEKEALAGVFAEPCEELGVSLFACKGYPSISALHTWVQEMAAVRKAHTDMGMPAPQPHVVYFGDHDPDGFAIPRAALDKEGGGVQGIQAVTGALFPYSWERAALNMKQVKTYNPPPFHAKLTSSRYEKYVDEHGTTDAWELDALEPAVLQKLIRNRVNARFDTETFEAVRDEVLKARADYRDTIVDHLGEHFA